MASLSIKEALLKTAQTIKQYVDDKISDINIPSLDGYATEEYVDDATINAVLKTPQELTVEEAEQVRVNIKTIGKDMTGIVQTPYTIEETSEELIRHYTDPVEGGEYAEVYNDPENVATGAYSNAKGYMTQATGNYSESSGWATIASGIASKASGLLAVASGPYAIAEGTRVQATKNNAHAEGDGCIASGNNAHAEGYKTKATTNQAHSEGGFTTASGVYSHAEGEYSTASARGAHAEGYNTVASGRNSFAAGEYTQAAGRAQFVIGKYNTSNSTDIFIIGNGTADTTEGRKNAFTIDPNGNTWIAGNITVGEDNKELVTKDYADETYAKIGESGDIKVDGEIQADNVPYIESETTVLTIPAADIQNMIDNDVQYLTIDAFTNNTDVIVYALYGGKEYASISNNAGYIEFFIANPYVDDGFACVFENGKDADGNADETKARFTLRVLDTANVTDLVLTQLVVSTIDSKYFDHDFTVINSISMNRRGDTGIYSTAIGTSCVASGNYSFAAGLASEATAPSATALGKGSFANGEAALSAGLMTTAGREAFATGRQTQATGRGSLSTGNFTKANGQYSVAEGEYSEAKATGAHAEGSYTLAGSVYQHVQGKYNIEDNANKYAHIVGNGSSTARSNAHTLDWNGNAWFAGTVKVGADNKELATKEYVEESNPIRDYTLLKDQVTNNIYALQMRNGALVTTMVASNIEVASLPNKTEYFQGFEIELDGLQLKTVAADGTESIIDNSLITIEPEIAIPGVETIVIKYNEYGQEYTTSFDITFTDSHPGTYTVESVGGDAYDFVLNSDGYYESTNKGHNNSYALCRVVIDNPSGREVFIDYISSGEGQCDKGILSDVNTELLASASEDTVCKKKLNNYSSVDTGSESYGNILSGVIYVKYFKDVSSSEGRDSLQFKVRFE